MKLTEQQQIELRERGIVANEACDKCGTILGAVRFTRRGEPGEWCSRECRDGLAAVQERQARRAGRGLVRRKYASVEDRLTARRANGIARQQRLRQQKASPQIT